MATPPALGTVGVGSLYANASDRALWLGVDPTVNPAGAIILSDPVADAAAIAAAQAAAQAYTDAQLAGKSNVGHTHIIPDITGLSAALAAASTFQAGMIIAWYGTIISIPAGWALCDGNNGTPDLRDRFILGAGGVAAQGSNGGSASASVLSTAAGGAHSHGGATQNHTLTAAQMPVHNHPVSDPGHAHNTSDPGHTHITNYPTAAVLSGSPGGSQTVYTPPAVASQASQGALTGVTVAGALTGVTTSNAGSGGAHAHNISAEAAHTHALSGDMRPPFKTLAYIMKLP